MVAHLRTYHAHMLVFFFVHLACEPEYSHGLLWGRHQSNQLVHIRCSAFHSNFRSGVYITRMCDENGEWGEVDFSMCTMKTTATPLIVFEVNTTTSPLRTSAIVNEVCKPRVLLLISID